MIKDKGLYRWAGADSPSIPYDKFVVLFLRFKYFDRRCLRVAGRFLAIGGCERVSVIRSFAGCVREERQAIGTIYGCAGLSVLIV